VEEEGQEHQDVVVPSFAAEKMEAGLETYNSMVQLETFSPFDSWQEHTS
jgi:hypothetical protein